MQTNHFMTHALFTYLPWGGEVNKGYKKRSKIALWECDALQNIHIYFGLI